MDRLSNDETHIKNPRTPRILRTPDATAASA